MGRNPKRQELDEPVKVSNGLNSKICAGDLMQSVAGIFLFFFQYLYWLEILESMQNPLTPPLSI